MSEPHLHEWLASREADGTLSADERRALAQALAADSELAPLARQYDRLHSLLQRYAATRITPNAAVMSDQIREAIHEFLRFQLSQELNMQLSEPDSARLDRAVAQSHALQRDDAALRATDALLQRYAAAAVPEIPMLSSRISAAIRREPAAAQRRARSRQSGPIPFRRYVPSLIAAAALIFMAIIGVIRLPKRDTPLEDNNRRSAPTPVVLFDPAPQSAPGAVDVAFDQSIDALAAWPPANDEGGMISSSRAKREAGEARGVRGSYVLY